LWQLQKIIQGNLPQTFFAGKGTVPPLILLASQPEDPTSPPSLFYQK
jgi:hypothetical protein